LLVQKLIRYYQWLNDYRKVAPRYKPNENKNLLKGMEQDGTWWG
jgi:hypothetical protein